MQKTKKTQETIEVETHEIVAVKNKFRAQSEQIAKDLNDPEKSIFWTAKPGSTSRMHVFEALMRTQRFTINGTESEYDVLDFKGTVEGNVKITSFPSFVLRTAMKAMTILERHDDKVPQMEAIGENVAFADRPWVDVRDPFVIEGLFANVKGVSRVVHIKEVEA